MKVRLHHQYIRFRLDKSEVEDLSSGVLISTAINHGKMSVSFDLTLSQAPDPVLTIKEGKTIVQIPSAWTIDWKGSDTVGFEFEVQTRGQDPLVVVVEKDYPCAHTLEGKAVFGRPLKMPINR